MFILMGNPFMTLFLSQFHHHNIGATYSAHIDMDRVVLSRHYRIQIYMILNKHQSIAVSRARQHCQGTALTPCLYWNQLVCAAMSSGSVASPAAAGGYPSAEKLQ